MENQKKFVKIFVSSEPIKNSEDKVIYVQVQWRDRNLNHQIVATYLSNELKELYNKDKHKFMVYQINYLANNIANVDYKEQLLLAKSKIKYLILKELNIIEDESNPSKKQINQ